MITLTEPFSRITLRGKLYRSDMVWPLPIVDFSSSYWVVWDTLMKGDRITLPDTNRNQIFSVSVMMRDPNTWNDIVRMSSWRYHPGIRVFCEGCLESRQMDLEVHDIFPSARGYPEVVFYRHCPCGEVTVEYGSINPEWRWR